MKLAVCFNGHFDQTMQEGASTLSSTAEAAGNTRDACKERRGCKTNTKILILSPAKQKNKNDKRTTALFDGFQRNGYIAWLHHFSAF